MLRVDVHRLRMYDLIAHGFARGPCHVRLSQLVTVLDITGLIFRLFNAY